MKNTNNKPRVIHVDDNGDFLELFSHIYKNYLHITSVENSGEAVGLLEKHVCDVVVIDYEMQPLNGLELLKGIKEKFPLLPVIFLTGQGNEEIAREAFLSGAHDYFTKDMHHFANKDRLVNSIRKAVEMKDARRSARESQEKYKDLVENLNEVVYMLSRNGIILYASSAIESVIGLPPDEVVSRPPYEIITKEDHPLVKAHLEKVLSGKTDIFELRFLHRDGSVRWARASSRMGNDGNIHGVLIDISRQKEIEDDLRHRMKELSDLAQLSQKMGEYLEFSQMSSHALKEVCRLLNPDLCLLFVRRGNILVLEGTHKTLDSVQYDDSNVHKVGECLCGLAVTGREAIFSRDIHCDARCKYLECKQAGMKSFAAVPLMYRGDVIGVLGLASLKERDFHDSKTFLQSIAGMLSISLKNSLLYREALEKAGKCSG